MHRILIDLFFIVMIFEGLVRKLFLPSLSVEIQVFRDLLPLFALGTYFLSGRSSHDLAWPPAFIGLALGLYIVVASMQLLNPGLWTVPIGLLGLRTHFGYLPLLLLAPIYISSSQRLISRLVSLCIITFVVVALGVLQTRLPASHPLNANIEAAFGSEGLVRASGTFSYLTSYAVFCQVAFVLAVVLILLRPLPSRLGVLGLGAATVAFIGCLSSGSRGAVFGMALYLGIFSAMLLWSGLRDRLVRRVLAISFVGIFSVAVAITWVPEIYTAFSERAATAGDDIQARYIEGLTGWISVLDLYPWGNGIGMGHQQAGVLAGYAAGFLSGYETELERIAYELGIFGFLGFFLFRTGLLLRIGFGARNVNHPTKAILAALSFSTLALSIPGAVYTPLANALVMLLAGLGLTVVSGRQRHLRSAPARRSPQSIHYRQRQSGATTHERRVAGCIADTDLA